MKLKFYSHKFKMNEHIKNQLLRIIKNSKEKIYIIKLTKPEGAFTIVDEESYFKYCKYKWHINYYGTVSGRLNDSKKVLLHRIIMNAKDNEIVNHKDTTCLLDNRPSNLYINNQINKNRKIFKNKISCEYKHVFYDKKIKKYYAKIKNGKYSFLGYFENPIKAAERVDLFIINNNLSLELNFKDKVELYKKMPFINPKSKSPKKVKYLGVCKKDNSYITRIIRDKRIVLYFKSEDPIECAKKYDAFIVNENLGKEINFKDDYPNYKLFKTNAEFLKDDINTMKLLIKSDKECIIDAEDYEKIKNYKCHYNKNCGYVYITIDNKTIGLHGFIMNDKYIDHINGDKCNNKKNNLRKSNNKKNPQNKNKLKTHETTSKYVGVSYNKNTKKWSCSIMLNNRTIFKKYSNDEITAVCKRDLYILTKLQDTQFRTNFEWSIDEIIDIGIIFDMQKYFFKKNKRIKLIKSSCQQNFENLLE